MNYYESDFLSDHIKSILAFYDARVVDKTGGYFQNYYDNGELFYKHFRQLVSSTRIIVNYAQAGRYFNRNDYLDIARHGLAYLENVHWQKDTLCYAWTLKNHLPEDMTQQAYGYAFVLLAYAEVKKAGIINSEESLLNIFKLLEQRFWQAEYGLYADEINSQGVLDTYRGQNANMHLCEAMIAAYEATNNSLYINRAMLIAENIVKRQANLTDGLVWEHYTPTFKPDWLYNKDDPKNLYRPWGFQSGHQTEWTKLLLLINRLKPNTWLVDKAIELFDRAYDMSWDSKFGGLVYGVDPEGSWCDDDKYFWVQAESFAAAAHLYQLTRESHYLDKYNNLWTYCWQHMIDHQHGAWYRVLRRNNQKISNIKSSAGAKCDYHTIGSCFEIIKTLEISNV